MATEVQQENDLDDEVLARVEERLLVAVHEIRQPLAAVHALVEAAAAVPGVPEGTRRYLDQIVEQVQEASHAVSNVLLVTARSAPQDTPSVVVGEIVDSVLRSVRLTWKGRLVCQGSLDGATTSGSRALIRRCVLNVVENAVRAAGRYGHVEVTKILDGDWIRIVVEDDGPGFGRVPSGTGLGLAVTRMNLRTVGGSLAIGVTSSLGGARVALCLPADVSSSTRVDAAAVGG
jgi:signal transduction histidine kinase